MLSLDQQNALREQYRKANPNWQPATELYAELVRSRLKANGRLLDLGCGRGGLIEQLDRPIPNTIGVDVDYLSLKEHRMSSETSLSRAVAFSERLPFRDNSFDIIIASWVLEHLAIPEEVFGQIGRVLKPGGVFIFITPNYQHPLNGLNHLLSRSNRAQHRLVKRFYGREPADTFPAYYRANTKGALEHLAEAGRLHLAQLHSIPDPTYLAFNTALFHLASWFESTLPASRRIHLVGCLDRPTS
jgi:ubiquinone/menaquinone biosynthesis C-methylase UbiE